MYDVNMAQWEKLISKVKSLNQGMRFDELKKILEKYGYTMTAPSGGSSHYTFRKKGCSPITIPKHEPIKVVYIKLVRDIVESDAEKIKQED